MNIYFPPSRENELHDGMKLRATSPWAPQEHDTFNRPVKDGSCYFHRDVIGDQPSCTLCIHREKDGHWVVCNIVPDEGQIQQIPLDTYKAILGEFESQIADPATEAVKGHAAIEFSVYRLEDYFSPDCVKLLDAFCNTSNGLGSHPSDQEMWMQFLLAAFDDGRGIHCDVFGNCLKTAAWWPEENIPKLVHEYDFAMHLLQQAGRNPRPGSQ